MKQYLVGIAQEIVLLVAAAILYDTVFILFVREGNYLFLGSGYFLFFEAMVFPTINIFSFKGARFFGNILGVVIYFIFFLPLALMLGGA